MNENTITINRSRLKVLEYKNTRLLSINDVDRLLNLSSGAALSIFKYMKESLIEGEDYYYFKNSDQYYLTLSGYLFLSKMVNSEDLNNVSRQLIKFYFTNKTSREYVTKSQIDVISEEIKQLQKELTEQTKYFSSFAESMQKFTSFMIENTEKKNRVSSSIGSNQEKILKIQ